MVSIRYETLVMFFMTANKMSLIIAFLLTGVMMGSGNKPLQAAHNGDEPVNNPVWMTYVNVVKSLDEDFQDLKAHGMDTVEINTYDSIWVGDTINLAEALKYARKHDLKLTSTLVNIPLRADRVEVHGFDPVSCVMIGGAYQGKAIDWHRFSFTPKCHDIIIERPIFGSGGKYFAEVLVPHKAEVIVKNADYDGQQHLSIIPVHLETINLDHYRMSFDLTEVDGDLDNVMLAVYWRLRGPIYQQPQPVNYFGNTSSPHAKATRDGLRAEVKYQIDQWKKANGGKFPDDVVIGFKGPGDEDFFQTVPNGPAIASQSMPLWDFSDEAVAAFKQLRPQDEYPRHWTYREAFGEEAYAAWMWSLHKACAELVKVTKETLREEGVGHLLLYRANFRCDVFYVGNDHGGMGPEMVVKELDISQADPYPSNPNGYNGAIIPVNMGYIAGLTRRYEKELMPWVQGHNGRYPLPDHLEQIYSQHLEHEPDRIMYLGYGKLDPPPIGTIATFPTGNPDSWEVAQQLNTRFQQRNRKQIRAKVAALRDYRVWALNDFGQRYSLDNFLTDILYELSVNRSIDYDPMEIRSLNRVDWKELESYPLVLTALPVSVSAQDWGQLSACSSRIVALCPDTTTFKQATAVTGVTGVEEMVTGTDRINTEDGHMFTSEYVRTVAVENDVEILARFQNNVCIWRKGRIIFVAARIVRSDVVGPFVNWLAAQGCSELVNH